MRHYRTILVTGCPRSGTTPVGANLALAAGARYLYEPFNPSYGLQAISRYYQLPGADGFSPGDLDACVEAIRTLRLELRRYDGPHDTGWRRRVKRVVGGRSHLSYWLCRLDWTLDTIVWKDPIACLSTAAVVDRHRIPVVVTVRPAAAVAASYKRLQWNPGSLQSSTASPRWESSSRCFGSAGSSRPVSPPSAPPCSGRCFIPRSCSGPRAAPRSDS